MSAVQIAAGARLRRGVPTVVAGLALVAALAAGGPARASMAAATNAAAAARATASGGTWAGARGRRYPASRHSPRTGVPTLCRCRAPRRATAAPAGTTSTPSTATPRAFVVSETDGTWGTAKQVPARRPQPGRNAAVNSVSCASAGNCSAGGYYTRHTPRPQAFVVSETNGTWGTAEEVPGTAALNKGGNAAGQLGVVRLGGQLQRRRVLHGRLRPPAGVRRQRDERHLGHAPRRCPASPPSTRAGSRRSTRCRAPRRATAAPAGTTPTAPATSRRSSSARRTAPGAPPRRCPAPRPSTRAGSPEIASVSCGVGGQLQRGRVLHETQLRPTARRSSSARPTAPGAPPRRCPAPRPSTRAGAPRSPRCRAPRRATAAPAGATPTASGHCQAFVVSETDGTWGTAEEVPGTAALNTGRDAQIDSVSCASAGNCSAGGGYTDQPPATQAFVVSETNGTWGTRRRSPAPRPSTGRERRDQLGVVRLGGQLQRRRVLHDQAGNGGFNEAFVVDET